ncbi:MAG: hypothetical protein IPK57_09240 [Chitinophagaceae bacterium]|nr:hypothetical protein [Chitinophagaceae bacterium]
MTILLFLSGGTTATGGNSLVMGRSTKSTGWASVALGNFTEANGDFQLR